MMPANRQYNEYVRLAPDGGYYVVVSNHIDAKKQLDNDRLILRKATDLLREQGVLRRCVIGVWWYETTETDIDAIIWKNNSSYEAYANSSDRSDFLGTFLRHTAGFHPVGFYRGFDNRLDDKDRSQEVLGSPERYRASVKKEVSTYPPDDKSNVRLFDELLR